MAVNNSRQSALMPFFFAGALILGVFIGTRVNLVGERLSGDGKLSKLVRLIDIIEREYVSEVDADSLSDVAIAAILERLDPHSTYIPPAELQAVNEDMEGNFEGVGIEFNLLNDTISVVAVIAGGPSEKSGILPGDKIVKIDGEAASGVKIDNGGVIKKLRGKRGTSVKVDIERKGSADLLAFEIIRDQIPLYSVDASFMLDTETGYVKISRFSATTFDEYKKAAGKLKESGAQKLVLDLRGNPGGYLDQAIKLADEFLPAKELVVYTEGKNRKKQEYRATSTGDWEKKPVAVLIDESSASASEIVAGALQDQDRGIIVGHRSFGKGLVQEQIALNDGSALRLTVARYYTPSGRSIQRSYENGTEAYYREMYDRKDVFMDEDIDSLYGDTVKYYTKNGRVVYGGGGIHPDVFVKSDSADFRHDVIELFKTGAISRFSFDYANKNREAYKKKFPEFESFSKDVQATEKIKSDLISFLAQNTDTRHIRVTPSGLKRVKAFIARYIWGNAAYYHVLAIDDMAVSAARKALEEAP